MERVFFGGLIGSELGAVDIASGNDIVKPLARGDMLVERLLRRCPLCLPRIIAPEIIKRKRGHDRGRLCIYSLLFSSLLYMALLDDFFW